MSANDAVDGARSAAPKCYRLVASMPERFKEVRPGNDDGVLFWRNWRGHDDVMQTRSIRGSGEPAWVIASLNACLRLGPDPRRALRPAATSAAQTGRTHDRTRPMLQTGQKVLAKAAPSTHGPKRTSARMKSGGRSLRIIARTPLPCAFRLSIAADRLLGGMGSTRIAW
jgi:hypothetical protein